jgi:putative ATP-binding cassette transporter
MVRMQYSTRRPDPSQPAPGILRAFLGLAGGYWRGPGCATPWCLALGLLTLNAGEVALLLRLNRWNRDLFDALERHAELAVLAGCGAVLALLAAGFGLASYLNMLARRRLALGWRGWLTARLTLAWLAGEGTPEAGHANADGRIAEDARIATEEAVELACSFSQGLMRLACFVGVLWALSAHPAYDLAGFQVALPGYLLWFAMLYAGFGICVASLLSRPLVHSTEQRQTSEAEYRVALVTARDAAGEAPAKRLAGLFGDIAGAFGRQTRAAARLQLFGVGNLRLGTGLPFLLATPAYLAGVVTLGWVMQAAQAFQEVAGALNWPVDNMPRIATWRASAQRVLALHQAGFAAAPDLAPRAPLASVPASAYMPASAAE